MPSERAEPAEHQLLAADVWRRMLDYHMAHLRHLQTARQLGLNPGATKRSQPDSETSLGIGGPWRGS